MAEVWPIKQLMLDSPFSILAGLSEAAKRRFTSKTISMDDVADEIFKIEQQIDGAIDALERRKAELEKSIRTTVDAWIESQKPKVEGESDASVIIHPGSEVKPKHFKDDQIEVTLPDGSKGVPTVKGLSKHEGMFTPTELEKMTEEVDWLVQNPAKLHNSKFTYNKSGRRTQINFGYYYSYGLLLKEKDRGLSKGAHDPDSVSVEPMPSWMEAISDRLVSEGVLTEEERPNPL